MAKQRKFTPEVEDEIATRYVAGESKYRLCEVYATCLPVINRILKEHKCGPNRQKVNAESRHVVEFAKRVKSVLWRQGDAKQHDDFESWKSKVAFLQSPEGANYTHAQAVVQATKDYPCCYRLFREYDLKDFDPNPDSHPQTSTMPQAKTVESGAIICDGLEQSYRDSLRWAIDSAGCYLRTGVHPTRCPCDAAFYLYKQAIEEPKDFLAKVGQIESRASTESEKDKDSKESSRMSIREIDEMLNDLGITE